MHLNDCSIACIAPVQMIILSAFILSSSFALINSSAPNSFAFFSLHSSISVAITSAPVSLASEMFIKPETPEPRIKTIWFFLRLIILWPRTTQARGSIIVPSS